LFKAEVGKGNVEAIYSRGAEITGRFVTPVAYSPPDEEGRTRGAAPQAQSSGPGAQPKQVTHFVTTLPSFVDPGLEKFLIDHGVQIRAQPIQTGGSPWVTLLYGFGPALLIIGFYVWMFRRAQQAGGVGGGLMGIGKSKARRYDQQADEKVTFDDVAGIDEAENELIEVVDFLKNPPKYTRLGGTAPKLRGCYWLARRGPGRHCWRARWPGRRAWRSSP
jgi:cell division protease FtsH